jgi:hypothetical protein
MRMSTFPGYFEIILESRIDYSTITTTTNVYNNGVFLRMAHGLSHMLHAIIRTLHLRCPPCCNLVVIFAQFFSVHAFSNKANK